MAFKLLIAYIRLKTEKQNLKIHLENHFHCELLNDYR